MTREERIAAATAAGSVTTNNQKKHHTKRINWYDGKPAQMTVTLQHDDECGNGHNTFSVTAEIRPIYKYRGEERPGEVQSGGCLHAETAKHFPELAHLIKYHLCSAGEGPSHYIANAMYHAGDRDHWGKAPGEVATYDRAVFFGTHPVGWRTNNSGFLKWLAGVQGSDFELLRIDHNERKTYGPKWTLGGAPDKWHECPFDSEAEGMEFLSAMKLGWRLVDIPATYSEGKPRDLAAARVVACWPDATDDDLTAPDLKDKLIARLPTLMAEFRAAVESAGLVW